MARSRFDSLGPIAERNQVERDHTSVAECIRLRQRGVFWSFDELADPSSPIARLRVGGTVLEATDILSLSRLTDLAMSTRAAILAEREVAPTIWGEVEGLPRELNSLAARIANKILPNGELDDRASPELGRIRHDINRLRSSITRSLESLMRRSEDAVQDELVTVRNDRFVIPIKADHRARVQGVAHGFSSSGATAFVEPMETVEANNELQNLRELEQREIHRILSALTEDLRSNLPAIESAVSAVAELDFVNAKALFYQRFDCVVPEISADNGEGIRLELVAARHPLLEENLRSSGNEVVPVSFALDTQHDSLVISGANAGGKTVVLKTAGLLTLMALSGLPVPANSFTVPFYSVVLADIGDHQSLSANLSTFTSHIANISQMLELCEWPALVLLDEVGTGTDPEEGSALGVAVVDHFRKACKANVMATTHYSGLKMYGASEPGVLNASVEFDERTLQPTYRLIIGVAGASSGLEIARRFGVPDGLIEDALSQVKESSRQATEFLRRIKREADEALALRKALEEERAAVAEKFASLEKEAARKERNRQEQFERELEAAVRGFEKTTQQFVSAIEDRTERLKVEREVQKRAAELKRATIDSLPVSPSKPVRVVRDGRELVPLGSTGAEAVPDRFVTITNREIREGDKVRLKRLGSVGIVDQIKHGEAEVRVKALRFREKLEALELVEEVQPTKNLGGRFSKLRPTQTTVVRESQTESAPAELNVIGQTTDEAVDIVDKFLDKAFMNSLSQVRIIHGHGTGALRRAIGDHLKQHPHVLKFMPASAEQGGAGATLVELKQ
jgi:DNA mismatch repair protein MutS2